MALEVSPTSLRQINNLKAKRAEREAAEIAEAEELARKISKLNLKFTLETGQAGKAFGSVTAQDISDKLKGELGGLIIDRHKIRLDRSIKDSGEHFVEITLHPEVKPQLRVNVEAAAVAEEPAAEADEAGSKERKPRRKSEE